LLSGFFPRPPSAHEELFLAKAGLTFDNTDPTLKNIDPILKNIEEVLLK
jgi:hypothetical protein